MASYISDIHKFSVWLFDPNKAGHFKLRICFRVEGSIRAAPPLYFRKN